MTEIRLARNVEVPYGGRSCRDSGGRTCFLLDNRKDMCLAALFEVDPQKKTDFDDAYVTRRRVTVANPDTIAGGCPNTYTMGDIDTLAT